VFVRDAEFPTALAWTPDGRLFFAERAGTVKVVSGTDVTTFATVPTVTTERTGGYSERGLLGLAVSPTFTKDRFVYAMYSSADREHQVVVRWRECRGAASDERTIVELPAGDGCCHKGGRLAFGPDGKLYVTLGEQLAGSSGSAGLPAAQDTADVRGKVLRYEPDGSVPSDNPFGSGNPVWAAGLRNVFGLAFGPDGALFVTDNGPTGDAGSPRTGYDLALLVTRGGVYQWPYCYGYGHPTAAYQSCMDRPPPPWSSERDPTIPTGATYVDARGPAAFAGSFVFCNYVDGMRSFTAQGSGATVTSGPDGCRLDVKQGPDHALYYSDETGVRRLA
jgi:glucose/arabinose dehydrogenase